MNTPRNASAQNSEQTHLKTIHDLHQAFANLAISYGMLTRKSDVKPLDCLDLEDDCEKLASIAQALRMQAKGGVK